MLKILTMIAIAVAILIASPSLLIAQDKYPDGWCGKEDAMCLIKRYTAKFHSSTDTVYSVMMCEGGLDGKSGDFRDGAYHSFRWFAYFTETWERYSQKYRDTFGVEDEFDINSLHDQVKLTSWIYSLEEVNKEEWTTYRAIKNGGTYTFYSKFHKKWFTIFCTLKKIPV